MSLCADAAHPFKEQFNLPYLPLQFGNGQFIKLEVVGEKTVNRICIEAFIYNKSKRIRILLRSKWPSLLDGFIREKSG